MRAERKNMGIENGPSGAVAVAGPAVGLIGGFGPKFESLSYSPIDSPIGKGEIQNMVSYKVGMFDPAGSINFSSVKEEKPTESLITEGAIPTVPRIEPFSGPEVLKEASHWLGIVEAEAVVRPGLTAVGEPQPFDYSYAVSRIARPAASTSAAIQAEVVYAPAIKEQLVQEAVRVEETKVEDRLDEASEIREEEEIEELTVKYVEDEEVSSQRRFEIREAIRKAKLEAEKEGLSAIEGWRIKKYLQPEHAGIRSGIAEPGIPDGSLVETYQDISVENYDSEEQANRLADSVITEKKPVKKAKEGKKVKERDIARVRRDPFLKRHPTEEVVARVVKKKILAEKLGQKSVLHEVKPQVTEGTIEDHPDLAEAFALQKAA